MHRWTRHEPGRTNGQKANPSCINGQNANPESLRWEQNAYLGRLGERILRMTRPAHRRSRSDLLPPTENRIQQQTPAR